MHRYNQEERFEKIHTTIFNDSVQASRHVANQIAELIRTRKNQGKNAVLGLATGSSPTGIYDELVRMHRQEGLSFKNVVTFNLDEYHPMQPDAVQSYVRFMHEYLFNHIDIPEQNIHIPDGTLPLDQVGGFCERYDRMIEEAGGIDIQILGIGRTGHIGFNEPGSSIDSPTRLINLDNITIADAASDFFDEKNVPRRAITMGIGTILKAKKIYLLAWGETKAHVLQKAVEEQIDERVPASFLQKHPDSEIITDEAGGAQLCRRKTPWIVKVCDWTDDRLVRKAVVWLCQKAGKPVLKLTDRDYNDSGLSDLLTMYNSAYKINIKVFNDLQHTITGWPGGKPGADDSHRPERRLPYPKRILVFSPHPDDDVISMGGTLSRLVEQGHEVHVAYQTSGSIAVFDDDVLKYLDFVNAFKEILRVEEASSEKFIAETVDFITTKRPMQVDTEKVQLIKAAIRKGEARSACRFVNVPASNIHFLNMPFYETGKVRKKPLSEKDIEIVAGILKKIRPHQIFAAGDLTDPHGTHRTCIKAIFQALDQLRDDPWVGDCNLWLYRGAWQEWDIDQADMAVPLSPDEVARKRMAIFKHQSQKDRPLFPGSDPREFWKRAEDRNHDTAVLYDRLGMAEYEAIEVFAKRDLFQEI